MIISKPPPLATPEVDSELRDHVNALRRQVREPKCGRLIPRFVAKSSNAGEKEFACERNISQLDWWITAAESGHNGGHGHKHCMKLAVLTILEAISTLLQPPIVRTGLLPHATISSTSQKLPTPRDIPPVTLTNVLDVELSVFENYLSQIGPLVDAFQRKKLESGDPQLFRQEISATKDDELASYGRRKASVSEHSQLAPTRLSTVPSAVYFDVNFRLENPCTFDVVSEHAEVVRQPLSRTQDRDKDANDTTTNDNPQPGQKALTINATLQEKLSWYKRFI